MQNLPIFNLPGPEFLNFFGVVVIAVLLATYLAIRFSDRTDRRPPPRVPQTPDAMEVAFLQGGVNQVIRTLVYDLAQRGFVALAPEDRVVPTNKAPQAGELNAMERRVLESARTKPKAHELFENRAQREFLEKQLLPIRKRLAAQDLLQPESVRIWKRRMLTIGSLALAGVAGVKLYVAFSTGHTNVSYLIFLSIASVAALFALAYVLTRDVASRRGRAYLDAMRLAYADRLKEAVGHIGSPGPEARAFEGASLFLIGLYGFSVLKGTTEAMFAQSFRRASGEGGGGCGSSCSGSCGDGGGGGCGGCGGGD